MKTPTVAQFKAFSRQYAGLAEAVALAQAFAQVERERVAEYIEPYFLSFGFRAKAEWGGDLLKESKRIYLSDEEERIAQYFAGCDKLHREHGFTGPEGHCPALVAEEIQRKAEAALLKVGGEFIGQDFTNLFGDLRKRALDLLMGACLQAAKERKAA